MTSILAGPSLLRRHVPSSMAALHGALATAAATSTPAKSHHFSTSLHARLPKSTTTVRASVSQIPYGSASAETKPGPMPPSPAALAAAARLAALDRRTRAARKGIDRVPDDPRRRATLASLRKQRDAAKVAHIVETVNDPNAKPKRKDVRRALRAQRKARKFAERQKKSIYVQAGLTERPRSPLVRNDGQFKTYKPLTPGLRWVRHIVNEHLHKGPALRVLTRAKRATAGRNNTGRITVRGRGGGHKRRLRMVDFYRWESGEQTVMRIEYDPGRSAHIALIEHNVTKIKSYILASEGLREGDTVQSYRLDKSVLNRGTSDSDTANDTALNLGMFRTQAIRPGNTLPLSLIPIGTIIHAVSLVANGYAKMIRSAGSYGQLVAFVNKKKAPRAAPQPSGNTPGMLPGSAAKPMSSADSVAAEGKSNAQYAQIKLQSGEIRLVKTDCCATVGRVSNPDHHLRRLGKAGRSRWLGRRPKVRGVAMNTVDHPHGGGRGKSKSNMHPRSIYGTKKGVRTRKPGTRKGNKNVVKERPRGIELRRK